MKMVLEEILGELSQCTILGWHCTLGAAAQLRQQQLQQAASECEGSMGEGIVRLYT